jgi:putative drug exporter of the RND superfamily
VEAVTTAGRSVIVAGGTVVIAVLGMLLIGLPYMYGVALSASLAVLVVMLAAVTLLPALLSYIGPLDHEVPVAPFMPVMMFAILFGLSMDYEVFLISRIRAEYVKHGDTSRAVADGLARTARVITAAAAIMVVVFLLRSWRCPMCS